MYRRFHDRFGTAGIIIAVIALVAALGGTALAAKGALTGKQKKEVKAIAKSFQGTGPAGANGTNGTNGKDGGPGTEGPEGPAGKEGKNVTFSPASEAACPAGGSVFEASNGNTTICNGKNGTTGFTKTLPPGETETGTWSIFLYGSTAVNPAVEEAISFPIPLAANGEENAFVFNAAQTETEEFGSSGCAGTVVAPTAPPGVLCVYTAFEELSRAEGGLEAREPPGEFKGYGTNGAYLTGLSLNPGVGQVAKVDTHGTWAVTAP
jgi:hypothetical protein